MPKQNNLQQLTAKWYKKLSDSGFEDIERPDGGLKRWHHARFQNTHTPQEAATKQEYYRLATHFLNDYKFKNATEKKIWKMHSEGVVQHDISKALMKTVGYGRDSVYRILSKLKVIMLQMYGVNGE